MSLVDELIKTHFSADGEELLIGGLSIRAIAAEFDTPLFVYDEGILATKLGRLRTALPDRVDIYYSVKANPSRALLKAFLARGCGLEIASGGELAQALAAGCDAERIVFAGPGKSDREIQEFLRAGGGEIHVESASEAKRLVRLSDELATNVRAAVRVNPTSAAQGGAMRMGGKPAPFGVDEESLDRVVEVLEASSRVALSGVHIFAGTQILDADVLEAQYRKCLEIASALEAKLGRSMSTIDFGGGLGIPYFDGDSELDVEDYGRRVGELVADVSPDTRLMIEPGRYLVGESGVYVVKVLDVKRSRDKLFAIADGGMNHHLAASGNLGQVIKRNFPVALVNKLTGSSDENADIVGPLCTPLDVLARNMSLPEVEIGDLVGVFQSGAYARAASPLGFLSHPAPAEVLVSNGHARVVRMRGDYDAIMRDLV